MTNRIRFFESVFHSTTNNFNPYAKLAHIDVQQSKSNVIEHTYKETFVSYDIGGRYFFSPKFQMSISATFTDNYQYTDDSITNVVAGVGDVQALFLYRIINTKSGDDSVKWRHRLTLGSGIKLPTGSYNKLGMENEVDPHLQPGSGSLDYLMTTEYMVRYYQLGAYVNVLYKLNQVNKNEFKFANRFNYNTALFCLIGKQKLKWMPSFGLSFESAERDTYKGENYLGSGGEAAFLTYGLKLFTNNFAFGFTFYDKPFHEDLYDQSLQLNNKQRLISEITYFFN